VEELLEKPRDKDVFRVAELESVSMEASVHTMDHRTLE